MINGAMTSITYEKQSAYGTAVATTKPWRANADSFKLKKEKVDDGALIGKQLMSKPIEVARMTEATLESPAYVDQLGTGLWSVLCGESTISDPAVAFVLISYNGASAYHRLTLSSSTLTAETSSNGSSWSADTAFNTTGSIDLTAAGFDTLTELQAAIAGYTGYDCILFGDGATSSALLAEFTATQTKTASVCQGGKLLFALNTTSTTTAMHSISNAGAGTDSPSFTFQVNRGLGTNQSIVYDSMVGKTLTLTSAAKDVLKMSLALTGREELTAQTDSAVANTDVPSYVVGRMKLVFENRAGELIEFAEVKNITNTLNPSLEDNRNVGDLYPGQPGRNTPAYDVSLSANCTSTQYAVRAKYLANETVSMYLFCKTDDKADSANSVPYNFLVRIPSLHIKEFDAPSANRDRVLITMAASAITSESSVYTSDIYAYVTDKVTAVY